MSTLTMLLILFLPLIGALDIADTRKGKLFRFSKPQYAAIIALSVDILLVLAVWFDGNRGPSGWFLQTNIPWIPALGMHLHLAMDGLSLLLVLLTLVLGLIAVLATPHEKQAHTPGYLALLVVSLTGIIGVFLAQDLILFFVFYEAMLVPAYFLLTLWGDKQARRAAMKFFIFTQSSGLFLLVAIIGLAFSGDIEAGDVVIRSFSATDHLGTELPAALAALFMLSFFIAFVTKLPVVPLHLWQADTYAASPPSAGIVIAGLMSKAGAYGLIRFTVPLFPDAAAEYASILMSLAAVSLVYCAITALGQTDFKRLIAYSSAGHLALIVIGAFSQHPLAYTGCVLLMLSHALSVSGLFLIAGYLERRSGTTLMDAFGGTWTSAPKMGAVAIAFAMATVGLPGLGNFLGEFLILAGAFQEYPIIASVGAVGAVLSSIYTLAMLRRIFFGGTQSTTESTGEAPRLTLTLCAVLLVGLLWLGLRPQATVNLTEPSANPMLSGMPWARNSPQAEAQP